MIPYDAEKILPEDPDEDPNPLVLREDRECVECETELPDGYALDDLEIEVAGDTLVIDGGPDRGNLHYEVRLPATADRKHPESKLNGPLLKVRFRKLGGAEQ